MAIMKTAYSYITGREGTPSYEKRLLVSGKFLVGYDAIGIRSFSEDSNVLDNEVKELEQISKFKAQLSLPISRVEAIVKAGRIVNQQKASLRNSEVGLRALLP
jgi:hypothetical protein